MRVLHVLIALNLIAFANAQQRRQVPTKKVTPKQQIADNPASTPFSNRGKVISDALPQQESLRGAPTATVTINANEEAKNYMSIKEASAIISANIFNGKFKSKTGDADEMPVLLFDISVSNPPASGLAEVAKSIIIRMEFDQALSPRSSDSEKNFFVVTTFSDAYSGYGRNEATIHRLMQEGLYGLSKEFATAFDAVH